jgi:glutathione S-transferase
MIRVHHLNASRSMRILWLLEELGLEYEIVNYRRNPETNLAPPELREINPLGKSPTIEDEGRVIFESGAIVDYLVRRKGGGALAPDSESPEYDDYIRWLHYAEGSAMLPVMLTLYVSRLGEAGEPLHPRLESEVRNHFGYISRALEGREYLVGDSLTGADVQMVFVIEAASKMGLIDDFENLKEYVERMQSRPAFVRASERSDSGETSS